MVVLLVLLLLIDLCSRLCYDRRVAFILYHTYSTIAVTLVLRATSSGTKVRTIVTLGPAAHGR